MKDQLEFINEAWQYNFSRVYVYIMFLPDDQICIVYNKKTGKAFWNKKLMSKLCNKRHFSKGFPLVTNYERQKLISFHHMLSPPPPARHDMYQNQSSFFHVTHTVLVFH